MTPIRIANCSGFFGDRQSAALEMVNGGPIDVLTGDWLAELTMLILSRIRARHPGKGFARTFVHQMDDVLGPCLDRGIKIVSNAGGLDPQGCAEAVLEVAQGLGLNPRIAWVDGDDLMPRVNALAGDLLPFGTGLPDDLGHGLKVVSEDLLTANAYLGCWGIVDALGRGADIVITGRVTDAAVVCGPAAWHHGWARTDLDQLAGAVVAGHVIECGAQATGGNYSFFTEIEDKNPRFGFPWAEIAADGSSIIGKHEGTGGEVSVGTVTSQLLYEIGGPAYLGPDVTTRFDTIKVEQAGPDRVQLSGTKGQAPPPTLKVAMNRMGGFRNSFSVALTGLEIEAKAALAEAAFWDLCPYNPEDFESVASTVVRTDHPDPNTQEEATASWRVVVKDSDPERVGRAFSDALVQTALSSIPGMYATGGGPTGASAFGVFEPALVRSRLVPSRIQFLSDQTQTVVSSEFPGEEPIDLAPGSIAGDPPSSSATQQTDEGVNVPLGTIVGTRSGDKGGTANIGVFVRTAEQWTWLKEFLTVERFIHLLPETADLAVVRYEFPNLWSMNFLVPEMLQEGVAASVRPDAQAKAVGEWLRSRIVVMPGRLLRTAPAVSVPEL